MLLNFCDSFSSSSFLFFAFLLSGGGINTNSLDLSTTTTAPTRGLRGGGFLLASSVPLLFGNACGERMSALLLLFLLSGSCRKCGHPLASNSLKT